MTLSYLYTNNKKIPPEKGGSFFALNLHEICTFISSKKRLIYYIIMTVKEMFKKYNPNPQRNNVGDCVVRSISKLLNYDWERAYIELAIQGFMMYDMPSANAVWGAYLRSKGFKRCVIPDDLPDWYTVSDFAEDHPDGTYLLATGTHVIAVSDGNYYDSWDSGDEIPVYYWVKEV